MGREMGVCEFNRYRAKRITRKYRNEDDLSNHEAILLGDYQPFVKPEDWKVAISYLRTHVPPINGKQ